MGFSIGFGSKKGKQSGSSATQFAVSELSSTDIVQNAFKEATAQTLGTSTANVQSLAQSLGIAETVSQQQVSGTQATTQTSQETGSTQTQAATQQQTSGVTTETGKQSAFADQDIALIREVLPGLFEQAANNFAVASGGDLPAQVAAIQRQLSEQVLPGIVSQDTQAGAYNTTSRELLANDAIARGAELAAQRQVENARTAGAAVSPITELSQILKGAEQSSTGSTNVLQSLLGTTNTQQISQLQNVLNALTQNQQSTTGTSATTTQEQQEQQQLSTEQNAQTTQSTETALQTTAEDTATTQSGTSNTQTKGKAKESGFSLGYSS